MTGKNYLFLNYWTSTMIYLKISIQMSVMLYAVYDGIKRKKWAYLQDDFHTGLFLYLLTH